MPLPHTPLPNTPLSHTTLTGTSLPAPDRRPATPGRLPRTRTTAAGRGAVGLAALAAVALLTGCTGGHDTGHAGGHGNAASPSSTTGATADDAAFAQMMIPHHQQAVEMATLAQTRAQDPEIKQLAAEIKAAQQPEIDQMAAWLAEWGVPILPADEAMVEHAGHGMTGMLTDAQLQQLAEASGAEFDRLFAEYMIVHHEGAIDMAVDVADSADTRVAALAAAIIATQQAEIGELQTFLNR